MNTNLQLIPELIKVTLKRNRKGLKLKGYKINNIKVQFGNSEIDAVDVKYETVVQSDIIPYMKFPIMRYEIKRLPIDCNIGLK